MCKCTDRIDEHHTIQIAPVVHDRTFGFALRCDGSVKIIGDYKPSNDTLFLLDLLSHEMRSSPSCALPPSVISPGGTMFDPDPTPEQIAKLQSYVSVMATERVDSDD